MSIAEAVFFHDDVRRDHRHLPLHQVYAAVSEIREWNQTRRAGDVGLAHAMQ